MNISLIIPTFNRPASCARLLVALMPQVLSRSFDGKVEVIVVDDNSSHASQKQLHEELAQYCSGSIHVIHREFSGGPSAARTGGKMLCGPMAS